MIRFLFLNLFLIASFGLSCAQKPKEIVIFHTNDIHGHFFAEPASWRKDHALVGGITALSEQLAKLRKHYPHSLFLDAGDIMTGNPICNIDFHGVRGGAMQEMMHLLGLTASCIGNHEFDLGVDHLRDFVAASPFPVVCSNLIDQKDQRLLTHPYIITRVNGLRVGIIGLIMDDLSTVVSKPVMEPFRVVDVARTAQQMIDQLDPETDLLILLTHLGADQDSILATKIQHADVIVGGHSHTRLDHPLVVHGILIVQAGSYCQNVGVLNLKVAGDSVLSYKAHLIELEVDSSAPHSEITSLADSLEIVIQKQFGQIIGDLETAWIPSYYTGSNVGNWICDRLKERYRVDLAFVNSGGLRKTINPGPLSLLDIQELMPFVNSIVLFEVTGDQLQKIACEQARAQGLRSHGALEMSGLTIEFNHSQDTVVVQQLLVNGNPVSNQKTYRAVSIDYVVQSQTEKYFGCKIVKAQGTGELLSEVITQEIQKLNGKPIHSDPHLRLREIP